MNLLKTDIVGKIEKVYPVGIITLEIYKCVTDDMVSDEVIITDERIAHIKERHPKDFERYCGYLQDIVENPDYIMESNHKNTALILKNVKKPKEEWFKLVLRLTTSEDSPYFKNSIITFMKVNEREGRRLLKNKNILYKREYE